MSTPIKEYIALNVETAINAVTTENEFNQDLTAVRHKKNDFSDIIPENGKVLMWQDDAERPEEEGIGTQQWILPFTLMAFVIDSDEAATSIDTRLNQVEADIQKKMREDITRGGYAFETEILPSAKFDDGKGFTGIAVNIAVHYRTNEDDPYTGA